MKKLMHINNEKGVALLMVLLIATITLAVTSTMLYMLVQSTRYSGLGKRFATASEAAMAASEVYTEFIGLGGSLGYRALLNQGPLKFEPMVTSACEEMKMTTPTEGWTGCDSSIYIDPLEAPGTAATYDSKFVLGNYDVFTKIVYTFKGNTVAEQTSGELGAGGSVDLEGAWRNTCVIHCQGGNEDQYSGGGGFTITVPYTYIIEIDARNRSRPTESAKISVLYQY